MNPPEIPAGPPERQGRSIEELLKEWQEFKARIEPLVAAAESLLAKNRWLGR